MIDTTQSFEQVSDEHILAALFGETVTIQGAKFAYTLTFNPFLRTHQFRLVFDFGTVNADETSLRLIRLV